MLVFLRSKNRMAWKNLVLESFAKMLSVNQITEKLNILRYYYTKFLRYYEVHFLYAVRNPQKLHFNPVIFIRSDLVLVQYTKMLLANQTLGFFKLIYLKANLRL